MWSQVSSEADAWQLSERNHISQQTAPKRCRVQERSGESSQAWYNGIWLTQALQSVLLMKAHIVNRFLQT